jgi:hypothetical protein
MTSQNLWGELQLVALAQPVTILRQQATKLGELTKNILTGEVRQLVSGASSFLLYALEVVAPAVGGYRHRVLAIQYALLTPYPLLITGAGNRRPVQCETEEEFIQNLASILQSDDIQQPIRTLLTLSLQAEQPADTVPKADTST